MRSIVERVIAGEQIEPNPYMILYDVIELGRLHLDGELSEEREAHLLDFLVKCERLLLQLQKANGS